MIIIAGKGKGKSVEAKAAGGELHPFLRGNFTPVTEEYISYACEIEGSIPPELLGGQYIRNGGNPIYPPEKGRHYHW
jgi:carotenoid cleavage dioxygenase-like enzyme